MSTPLTPDELKAMRERCEAQMCARCGGKGSYKRPSFANPMTDVIDECVFCHRLECKHRDDCQAIAILKEVE